MTRHAFYVALLGLWTAEGCASTQAEQVRDAHMQQIEGQAETQQDDIDKQANARSEQIEQQHDAHQKAAESSGSDNAASQKLAGISEQRATYASDARAQVNKLAVRIQAVQKKLDVLGSRAPTPLRTEMETVAQQYNLLKTEVQNLPAAPPDDWEKKKEGFEQRASLLDDRVSKLDGAVDDV